MASQQHEGDPRLMSHGELREFLDNLPNPRREFRERLEAEGKDPEEIEAIFRYIDAPLRPATEQRPQDDQDSKTE